MHEVNARFELEGMCIFCGEKVVKTIDHRDGGIVDIFHCTCETSREIMDKMEQVKKLQYEIDYVLEQNMLPKTIIDEIIRKKSDKERKKLRGISTKSVYDHPCYLWAD